MFLPDCSREQTKEERRQFNMLTSIHYITVSCVRVWLCLCKCLCYSLIDVSLLHGNYMYVTSNNDYQTNGIKLIYHSNNYKEPQMTNFVDCANFYTVQSGHTY